MKFLTKEDWENILNKLSFNKITTKETPVEKLFFEISQRIKDIITKNKYDHTSYGIAMTLFHYYICFNDIRSIDKIQICFACIYMSSKIQFYNYPQKMLLSEYKKYIETENIQGYDKKPLPDFTKYEVQLYSQLGYDLDIITPFQFFYWEFYSKYPYSKSQEGINKLEQLKNFCFNLINDTYTRPLSIYYHPKIIYLSCLIFSLKFLKYEDDINELLKNEKIDLITECMEKIYYIYSKYIEDNSNKKNNMNNDKINTNNDDA